MKHSWYLDPKLVPLALADDDAPDEERRAIADAILQYPMLGYDVNDYEADVERPDVDEILDFNASDSKPPSLAPLVNSKSYFIFASLGMQEDRIRDWLQIPVQFWPTQTCYRKFKEFCLQLTVVNDPAERAVGK